jgi:hypothetical protein
MNIRDVLVFLLLIPLINSPQQPLSNKGVGTHASADVGEATTLVGCVTGVNGSFTFETRDGNRYLLKGKHDTLFGYNGKEVQISGTVTSSKNTQALKIATIKKTYDTCQYQ